MANYQTHMTVSGITGVAVAAAAWYWSPQVGLMPLSLTALLGLVGGVIPDLDHDTGVAVHEVSGLMASMAPLALLAALVPGSIPWDATSLLLAVGWHYGLHALLKKIKWLGSRQGPGGQVRAALVSITVSGAAAAVAQDLPVPPLWAWLILSGAGLGALGLAGLFRLVTVHRGVFHSIPVVGIYGALVYLLSTATYSPMERWWMALGAWAGALSHLILDEIWSVDFMGARLKKSAGTALSFWKKKSPYASAAAWLLLLALLLGALSENTWKPLIWPETTMQKILRVRRSPQVGVPQ